MWSLCLTDSSAQQEIPDWQILLQLDNDLFAEADRDYTSGVRIGFLQEIPASTYQAKGMVRRLEDRASPLTNRLKSFRISDSSKLRFARGFGLTQLMCTPDNPRALVAPEGQRPYAGWLGLEYSLHVKDRNYANSLTFTLGSTGDGSLAEEAQNWVHRYISNSPLFQGWDSQVPSETTVNIHFDHKQRFRGLLSESLGDIEFDGYYETGISLGNFRTDAYLGGLARVGIRLPSNFSTPRVRLGSFGQELFSDSQSDERKLSTFLFAGLRGVAVAHDITLDGPIFREFDGAVRSKSIVGEALYGLGFRYRKLDLVFSQTLRSKEFEGQDKSQKFGSVMLGFKSAFN
ncbi:MAG: lipid A deacylase LpxR family protein [Gammaproteobacteria bacterium]|nr:lipid A deacylase LpxR family protein [Gammaproteobacteria bacterium]